MIISAHRILQLNTSHKIIENLDPRELNPEGVGFDLRVAEVYRLSGEGYLGVENRKTPEIEKAADSAHKEIIIKPGEFVLVKTMEKVSLPAGKIQVEAGREPALIMAHIYTRTTLFRCGISLMATKVDPGYSGELTFAMANLSPFPFKLEMGARIANIVFLEVLGELSRAYGGQWQGGRVTTEKMEKQV